MTYMYVAGLLIGFSTGALTMYLIMVFTKKIK